MTDSKELREFAEELALGAGDITLKWFGGSIDVERKADDSPVTIADRSSERFIRDEILKRYPDDTIIGEEYGTTTGTSGTEWIIDPIDGTKSFIRGVPLYGTMIGIRRQGRLEVGVIRYPGTAETISAHIGGGCTLNGEPCRVSKTARMEEAFFATTAIDNWIDKLGGESLIELGRRTRLSRTWGDAYGYMLVATGRIDIMVDPLIELHDYAAVVPIIIEAGGSITNFRGEGPTGRSPIVATNGVLHEDVLKVFADRR